MLKIKRLPDDEYGKKWRVEFYPVWILAIALILMLLWGTL